MNAASAMVTSMTMSETRSPADAKAHLSELVALVSSQHERVTVTVHGQPAAVLVVPDDLEALEETITILSDKAMMRALADSAAEIAARELGDEAELAAAMAARRPA